MRRINYRFNCTGCGACALICPHECIVMKENRIAELTPVVDKTKCNKCGLCKKVCPQRNEIEKFNPMQCYVAWSKKDEDVKFSASGGVAAVIARYQLSKDNKIYGCDYDSSLNLVHFQLRDEKDILKMQSSKYSQSSSFLVFKEIRQTLNSDKKVVFVGTPCQVAGLKGFLIKDFENLITIDLVCHGTPPNRYFKEYVEGLNINASIDKVRFRGEHDQKLTLYSKEKIVYQKPYKEDIYFSAFYKNKISMNNCYDCQYAEGKRVSDITLADFWGLGELNTNEKKSDRPSLIMINTERGKRFFNEIKEDLVYEQRLVEEAIAGNGRLKKSPGKSIEARTFQECYKFTSFITAVEFSGKINSYVEKSIEIKSKIKKFSKRVKKAIMRRIQYIK